LPLQNRVDPRGSLIVDNERGAWLGNRGILHDDQKRIIAPWRHKAWVTCRLAFKGRRRKIFSANHYSELFFLDEATAFAAGHRPCGECRWERYTEFKTAWIRVNGEPSASKVTAGQIDKQLHAERAVRGGGKVTYSTEFNNLSDGTFIDFGGNACMLWKRRLKSWSPGGYTKATEMPAANELVTVLTPFSIVQLYANGLVPQIHRSAG